MDFETTKLWFDGYLIDGKHMYNPNSVVEAMISHEFDSYWKNTSSFEVINKFITMNYEVTKAYQLALRNSSWSEISTAISKCDELLKETIDGNGDKVAEILELAHETYTSVLTYNDENSLSCVLTMAYFTAPAYYNIIREMPTGKGFADFIFFPKGDAHFRAASP